MLPFLKDRHEGSSMSGSVDETVKRKSDEGEDSFEMLDAIAEDLIDAVHKKDKKLLKSTLEALIDHIEYKDGMQDQEELE